MWWPQLVELRTELAPIRLPAAADFLKFGKGSKEAKPEPGSPGELKKN